MSISSSYKPVKSYFLKQYYSPTSSRHLLEKTVSIDKQKTPSTGLRPEPVLSEAFKRFVKLNPDVMEEKIRPNEFYSREMANVDRRYVYHWYYDDDREGKIFQECKPHGLPPSPIDEDDDEENTASCWCCVLEGTPVTRIENVPRFHQTEEYVRACRRLDF